ncbi:MAG TPA: ATP-binding protein, partial [Allosphingosinicella sp.]
MLSPRESSYGRQRSRTGLGDMTDAAPCSRPDAITASEWRQIVQSATDTGIISTDRSGRVTSWNQGAARLLGWTEEEMLGQTLERLFEDPAQIAREIDEAETHGRAGAEGWRLKKGGGRLWAAGEMSPIRNDSGAINGFVKILRDRTRAKVAEEEAAEERRALEILNRAGSALAAETDLERVVQIVTDAGVALTGAEFGAFFYNVLNEEGASYTLYTLSGAPIEAFSKFPMPRATAVFGPTFDGDGIVRSGDITQDPRYGHNAPWKGMPDGHLPVRSYLAVPVISRSSEVLGGLFFGHAAPGVFTDRAERGMTGLAAEAAVAIDNARLAKAAQREIAERRRAEDALRELNATLEQQVAERTEQLQAKEEALRQSQKMEAIGQLTGGVAHDFNNLLQVIIGNLDTITRNVSDDAPRLKRAAGQALNGARRAASLTQRLLAFSRRQPLDPKPVNVNALVTGLSEMVHRTLGETVDVETVLAAGLWQIEADANELESAILNLAVNARDAMPEGGRLTIETANAHIDEAYAASYAEVVPGQYVCVSVSDTGKGMDDATVGRAFEPFFTTKPVGRGTGLGLSQVYGFVKQSGGHIKIYSEIGEGTTVKIYLPRLATDAAAVEDDTNGAIPDGDGEETILVLEDDDDVRTYSVEILREL